MDDYFHFSDEDMCIEAEMLHLAQQKRLQSEWEAKEKIRKERVRSGAHFLGGMIFASKSDGYESPKLVF